MNRKSIVVTFGATVLSFAASATDQPVRQLAPICNLLTNDVSKDVEILINKFGNPKDVSVDVFPNKHIEGASDEVHTATIMDGSIAIYSVPSINRNYIFRIEFTNQFWPEGIPKYIARSKNDIEHIFGTPNKSNENSLKYNCDMEGNDYVEFFLEASQVVKMKAQKWID